MMQTLFQFILNGKKKYDARRCNSFEKHLCKKIINNQSGLEMEKSQKRGKSESKRRKFCEPSL